MQRILLCLFLLSAALPPALAADHTIDLSIEWRFAIDRADQGVAEQWFNRALAQRLKLPGSMQEQGFGDDVSVDTKWTGGTGDRSWFKEERFAPYRQPGNIKVAFWLQPEKYYVGAAWYQRDVTIPKGWQGRRVGLSLERSHWGTTVWLDDRQIGRSDALGVPHEYDLGAGVQPGVHRLTIRVDNRVLVPVGDDAHSVTDHTQGNWNGLAGELKLFATEPVWIENVQVFPHVADRKVTVRVKLSNASGQPGTGVLHASAQSYNSQSKDLLPPRDVASVTWSKEGGQAEFELALGPQAQLWDEFNPALYRLKIELLQNPDPGAAAQAKAGGVREPILDRSDTKTVTFGLREVGVLDKQIAINGRKIFLRGTLECCIFPLHGYPPTDVAAWKRVLTVARAHGLNHLRFHSWCPPEAAFVAADEMGFYYQVESSAWSHTFASGTALDQWIYEESERMVQARGNHPSFILMAPSNEPMGPKYEAFLGKFVEHWKAKDSRRLYTTGSGWPMVAENQFHVAWGSRGYPVSAKLGDTANDYSGFLAKQNVPVVSHEIGQYCVFPNLDEISKYRGPLKARNFEIVRDFMQQGGMANQARDFLRASGRLQALFYKDEIEACLRTPGWGGFQLLDLHDFPGQGTALVGVLDAFWEEKGYIKPAEYRRFCDDTVPLARLPKRIFTSDETFQARLEVAHFGPQALADARASWRIRDAAGTILARGKLKPVTLPTGGVTSIGEVEQALGQFTKATALNLEVTLDGTRFANDWNFWVYPATAIAPTPAGLTVVDKLDTAALAALKAGGRVVVFADQRTIRGMTIGRFDPIFWNRLWFPSQPQHTLGLLMDPQHAALAGFPTSFHADWQWQDLQNHSKPMVLDGLPKDFRPVVQVIDDWNSCRKLGLVIEARVGTGRLLVCAIDLAKDLDQRPGARHFRQSLVNYAASEKFKPAASLTETELQTIFRQYTVMEKEGARVIRADSAEPGFEASRILDGNPASFWHTPWSSSQPGFPHEVVLGFDEPTPLLGVTLLPRQDSNRNGWIKDCAVYISDDDQNWGEPVALASLEATDEEQTVKFALPKSGRFLKLVALSGFDQQPFASLAELTVLLAK